MDPDKVDKLVHMELTPTLAGETYRKQIIASWQECDVVSEEEEDPLSGQVAMESLSGRGI